GWAQARMQRHVDMLAQEHLRAVAEELDRQVRRQLGLRIVMVAAEEARAELDDLLSHDVRSAIVGWTQAEAHARPAELLKVAGPVLESWRSSLEQAAVERWRARAGRQEKAATGWAETLETASDGRVDLLLLEE